ncbi:MAG TPA: hypothetical protein VFH31_02675 [Pyrinomonadaceae bacterium]|nr:hypothetical protein [Pyrinomonadaceae bacterium]
METEDLINLADDPNLISGIYNYCDRWCERCPFSSRCLVYLTEKEDEDADPATRDITNAAFWNKLASIFQQTQEMITSWAKENGVDLSPEALAEASAQNDAQRKEARDHPLSTAAENYASGVQEWFEKASIEPNPISDTYSDLEEEAVNDQLDAAEVIRWYQFFIAAKIARGLMSRVHEKEYENVFEEDTSWRDSDGSIKVALIAIDRSISAWKLMTDVRGEEADSICELILQLEKLRINAEREFPNARDFVRPGFDEAGLDLVN